MPTEQSPPQPKASGSAGTVRTPRTQRIARSMVTICAVAEVPFAILGLEDPHQRSGIRRAGNEHSEPKSWAQQNVGDA